MRYLVPRQIFPMSAIRPAVGGHGLVVSAVVGFRLEEPGVFLEDQGLWETIQARGGQHAVFDLWMPKQGGELLVWGSAQAAEPVDRMEVAVRCGPLHKRLAVCGDRHWVPGLLGWKASEPVPFTDMPIVWQRSFGGPGVTAFPQGVGADAMALIESGQPAPLPNVMPHGREVLHPEDAGAPAGFTPLPRTAEVSATRGTFDAAWLARRFPAMPPDFEADFFNLAPADQRVPVSWQGGETVVIEGMNAAHPHQRFTLPSLRMRCFFTRGEGGGLIELAMRMDTIALYPGDGVGALVFRAEIEGAGHNGKAIAELMLGLEEVGGPKPVEHYRQVHQWRTDPTTRQDHLQADHELMPLKVQAADAGKPSPAPDLDLQRAAAARAAERVSGAHAALGSAAMASVLVSPFAPPPSAPEPAPGPEDEDEAAGNAPETPAPEPAAQRPARGDIDRLTDDLTQLAQRLGAEPQTPFASIMEEWLASQDLKEGMVPGTSFLKGALQSELADEPEVRQQMAQALLGSTAAMKDAFAGGGGDKAPIPAALKAMLEGAGGTTQIHGRDVPLPDMKAAAQAIGRPELADQLKELLDLSGPDGRSNALDNTQTQETLKDLLATVQEARQTLTEGAGGLEAVLPEGALTKDSMKGLLKGWIEGQPDEGNPLLEAARKSGHEMPDTLRQLVQSTLGEDAAQRGDALDKMFEQVTPDLVQQMNRGTQMGLTELMRMLQADEASEPASETSTDDAGDAALEAAMQATQEAQEAPQADAMHDGASIAADEEEASPKPVAADLAQARRDSRGRAFRPVDLSATAATALGASVLQEHATGVSFKDRDLAGADLSGADLSGADLAGALMEGADLSGANLSGARCAGAVLTGARLDNANCAGADFSGANLSSVQAASSRWPSANLSGAVLAKADLTDALMDHTRFDGCDAVEARLTRADLSHSHCEKGDFGQADLSGARLVSVDWTRTFLVGAVLDGCVATRASLKACVLMDVKGEGADLAQARLDEVRMSGACLPGLHAPGLHAPGSSWYLCQLSGAVLDGANLANAQFVQADLSHSRLTRADFGQALFTDSDLQGADLSGAQLCGASLQGANATAAQMRQAHLFGADLDGALLDRCDLSGATLDRTLLALPTDE